MLRCRGGKETNFLVLVCKLSDAILWREKLQAPQLFFGVPNLAPVNPETFCGMACLESRSLTRQQKDFAQPRHEPDQ